MGILDRAEAEVVTGTVYVEIFIRRNFSPILPSALIGEIFIKQCV